MNALGYFLADRGTAPSDFALAETLTRRALSRLDELAQSQLNLKPANVAFLRAIIHDSLAWSLFKQKKWDDAAREQRQAVDEARKAVAAGADDPNGEGVAELQSHLKQIEEALAGQNKKLK